MKQGNLLYLVNINPNVNNAPILTCHTEERNRTKDLDNYVRKNGFIMVLLTERRIMLQNGRLIKRFLERHCASHGLRSSSGS